MTYFIGQKVVCIGRGPWKQELKNGSFTSVVQTPIYKHVYTITGFSMCRTGIMLAELKHPLGGNHSWALGDFRPIIEKKTDISVFEKLLNTQKQKVDA